MKYYTKPKKSVRKPTFIILLLILLLIFYKLISLFNKNIFPAVIELSKTKVNTEVTEVISEKSIELFSEEFNYDEMIIIDKDKDDNINLIRANASLLNKLTSELTIRCNDELKDMGKVGIKVPVSWVTNNETFYNLGPKVTVKIEPVGTIKVFYDSRFESAGINQTRHIIYLNIEATVKIIMPLRSEEIVVNSEIPVSETIIVGKTPNTAIDMNK